ncbi:MAG: hypothetical protein L6R39_002328 [Caloplaca ligustica]|nr:MAG: hypothetical protein L6R39_002328 [Caloplaca ligustica]
MFRCASRLPRTLRHLHLPRAEAGRCFTAGPRSTSKELDAEAEEPSKEPSNRRWVWLGGLGVVSAGALGTALWFAGSDEPQRLQLDVFQDYELLKNKRISNTSNLLTIQPSTFGPRAYKSCLDGDKVAEMSRKGVWSVQIKHPLLTIARLYTPLPPFLSDPVEPTPEEKFGHVSTNPEENQLRFLIRNYPDGELSKYLSRMQAGGRLELRGPYQEFELPKNVEQVVFLAGGTGISPAIQVAHTFLDSDSNGPKPKVSILWANRRTDDCAGGTIEPPPRPDNLLLRAWATVFDTENPHLATGATSSRPESPIVRELSTLKSRYTGGLDVAYFADDQKRFITKQDIQRQLQCSATAAGNTSTKTFGKRLILVSGPDGFVQHFAGPKVWREGKELQGTLGGLLQKMDLRGWSVWKL